MLKEVANRLAILLTTSASVLRSKGTKAYMRPPDRFREYWRHGHELELGGLLDFFFALCMES